MLNLLGGYTTFLNLEIHAFNASEYIQYVHKRFCNGQEVHNIIKV